MEDSNLPAKNEKPSAIIRYSWDQDWADQIVHNIPITKVADELSQIKEVYGQVTPEILLESSKNKRSVFHHYFEWDDVKAANAFRIQRAKQILSHIEVRVIKDDKPIRLNPVEVKKVEYDFYYERFGKRKLYVKKDRNEIKEVTRMELNAIVKRIQDNGFSNVAARLIEDAIKELW